jgi:ABC-type transport system involved in cytochrome bd biosynthesis fused ATPase/permease subunit
VTLLVGANGSGKSTLLKLLLAIEPPREGRYLVDGSPPRDGAALRASIAYLPQRPYLSDRVTVREAFGLLCPAVDEAAAMKWIERVGMGDVLRRIREDDPLGARIGRLSAGQRQRVALARAGLLDRRVWLLDEPDASLDAEGLARLGALLDEERSARIIVVAAHADALVRCADRVLRVEDGTVTDEPRPSGTFP